MPHEPGVEAAAPRRWRVGAVRITQVVESRGASPPSFLFTNLTTEQVLAHAWLRPHFVHADGRLFASIHCFIVESEGRVIVIDTCVGNDKARAIPLWNDLHGPFLADLARAGVEPERVDVVLCTHLHTDHVGWNTRLVAGRWVPTFPRARYLLGRVEHEHWQREGDAGERDMLVDSVQPAIDAGLVDWVETDHAVTGEVSLEPTPGHTPGHVSVRIRSEGVEAVITGDLMHHPVQCCDPGIRSRFDSDPEQALRTRLRFLQAQAGRDVLVLGTHFAPPVAGWIVAEGNAFRLSFSPPGSAAAGR